MGNPTDPVAGYHDDVRRDIAPYLPKGAGKLLDLGGGTGATAAYFKAQGHAKTVGVVDIISSDLAEGGIDFHASGNLEDASFLESVVAEHGPFDVITTLDILEHLVDPWSVVKQLHAALTPGGTIVASIPNVRHYRVAGGLLFKGKWDLQDAGILDRTHLRFFVEKTAIELMTSSGLELVDVSIPPRMRRKKLAKVVQKLGLGHLVAIDYVVRVRRTY
jgi:2-polyprenyl-3-methyl-5-hydroxy-6-metoxy-1,4-benzoquinol methylase